MARGWVTAFWALLGVAVGSFLNVVADRWPVGGSLLSPPSHCDACGRCLRSWELVPILSYLVLRGRCRSCGARVGLRTLAVELGAGLLFGLAAWRIAPRGVRDWVALGLTSAYLSVLLTVTVTDLEHGLIPDRVTLPAIALAVIGGALTGWPGVLHDLGGGLAGAGMIALIIWLVPEGMGWGDVKLAGLIGLVTGLPGVWFALFIAFVSGGIVAGGLMATGRRRRGETIPLGPFLALGGGAALLYGEALLDAFYALAAWIG